MALPEAPEDLAEHYEEFYKSEAVARWREVCAMDKACNIAELAGAVPHDSILELGAGDGAVLKRLAETGFGTSLYALEISRNAVKAVEQKGISGLREAQLFDGETIPYRDAEFDLVVLSHVVEHLEHPRRLLKEAARVAKHVYVEVPLEYTWRLPQHFRWNRTGHINFFTPKLIRFLLETVGLPPQRELVINPRLPVYTYQYGKLRGIVHHTTKQLALRLLPGLSTQIFSYHYCAVCNITRRG